MLTFNGLQVVIVSCGLRTTRVRVVGSERDSVSGIVYDEYVLSHRHHKGSLFLDGVCVL